MLIQEANINPFNQPTRVKLNTESDNSGGLEFSMKDKNNSSDLARSGRQNDKITDLSASQKRMHLTAEPLIVQGGRAKINSDVGFKNMDENSFYLVTRMREQTLSSIDSAIAISMFQSKK